MAGCILFSLCSIFYLKIHYSLAYMSFWLPIKIELNSYSIYSPYLKCKIKLIRFLKTISFVQYIHSYHWTSVLLTITILKVSIVKSSAKICTWYVNIFTLACIVNTIENCYLLFGHSKIGVKNIANVQWHYNTQVAICQH